jgi:class 3 adenylate cyclase
LLAKDPAQRPADCEAVAARLAALAVSSPEAVVVASGATAVTRADVRRADWGRFVGRTDEFGALTAMFDDALSGRTRLAMVAGEPGIGKTRLVEELGAYAAMRGAQVVWGHCYEGDLGVPYLPFVEAFRSCVRVKPAENFSPSGAGLAEVATLLPELRDLYPDLPALPALEDDAERMRLFEGVASFVRAAAVDQPLILVLDDLHWAYKPSLRLLQHLMRSVTDARLFIVGTYRDVELDRNHPLAAAMTTLRRHRAYERVLLRGLPRDDVKSLVEAIGGQEIGDEFANLLARETEGNPFFVAEILRHLVETGAIRREAGQFVASLDTIASHLPEGVREVIGRRLNLLSLPCNEMLTVAAAMPAGFTIDVVARVIGATRDDDTMLDLLDEALAAQVIRERRGHAGTYEFAHALIRQTLYGELATPRRVRLHRRILEALEQVFATRTDDHLSELAYHAFQAAPGGDVTKAVDYATRAGDAAMAGTAYEEAARSYEMALLALEHSTHGEDSRPAELLLCVGRARYRGGDTVAGRKELLEAAEAARRDHDAVILARAAIEYVGGAWSIPQVRAQDNDDARGRLLDESATELRDRDLTPDGLTLLAQVLACQSTGEALFDPERALNLAEEALAVARRCGSRAALVAAFSSYNSAIGLRPEQVEEFAGCFDDVEWVWRHRIASQLGFWYLGRGDRDGYDHWCARLNENAARSRSPLHLAVDDQFHAAQATLDGNYDEALARIAAMHEASLRLGDRLLRTNLGLTLWPVYREQGRLGELERPTRTAADPQSGLLSYRFAVPHILAETGRLEEAEEQAGHLVPQLVDWSPFDISGLYMFAALADIAWRCSAPDLADAALAWLSRVESGRGAPALCLVGQNCHGAVARARGLALEVLGRADDAVEQHEAAIAVHEQLRAPVWTARSRFDLARALARRGRDDDLEVATTNVNRAIETASRHGAQRLLDEALALKLALQGIAPDAALGQSIDAVSASLTIDRPDLRKYAAADGHVTFCFSDIVNYTQITERLGDARTHEILGAHTRLLRAALDAHQGTEVKSQGDGFMLVFADPTDALQFAITFQRAIASHAWPDEITRLQVRIGVHRGEAIRDRDDFFGRTVIVGARIAALAEGGEILVSDDTRKVATTLEYGPEREVTLKGIAEPHTVYALAW